MICSRCERRPSAPARQWCRACLTRDHERRQRLRVRVLVAYGGACACCGDTTLRFLTIVSDGSVAARAEFGSGNNRYTALWSRGCPREGLTLYCFNCAAAVQTDGSCIHLGAAPGKPHEIPSSVNGHSVSAKHGGAETVLPR